MRQADGSLRLKELGMNIDTDVDIGPDRFPHRSNVLGRSTNRPVVRHVSRSLDSHLQRRVTIRLHHPLGILTRLLRRGAAGALVDANLIPHAASE
jgi:hypothetical protein